MDSDPIDWPLCQGECRLVESGSHKELVAANGLYARLAALQFGQAAALDTSAA
ncbi:hypothetical protein HBA54_18145 [Pelagibius litoralis]|uniref:ATP-binding cassette, subfamily B n=1 Tax=Pelagibius litoralis TaxID=374515 RepID=A0A967EZY5_9PROT|nr:hypothetical protein [Pelagibius litoralis]NIA70520.1 hypothetical protein [Pelagibius litoralis]